MFKCRVVAAAIASLCALHAARAQISLIAQESVSGFASDLSGRTGTLENGAPANLLGGLGSGLAWAGDSTFLALPDRGPNASAWNSALDDITSYIPRFSTLQLGLTASTSGALPFTMMPTLSGTTLRYSATPLTYSATGAASLGNTANPYCFTGRSDNFDPTQG